MKKLTIIRLILILLLAAYASYLFHEFGHWLIGAILGNKMAISLNGSWPKSGNFLKESHSLYFSIGGPGFTILQAVIALLIIVKYNPLLAYPFLIFPFIFRVFSLTVGGFNMQDEAANFPDPVDRAAQEEEFSLELRARDRERKLIKKIEKTLQKIEEEEFGFCDSCGVEIGIRRLEARPTADLCIDCKTLAEIKEKQMAG